MSGDPEDFVGLIGLGPMGHGMGRNILARGRRLLVRGNRNRTPVESLVALGAVEAASYADMATRARTILLCLPSSQEVEAVVLGPGGLISHLREGQIIVDTGTSNPASTIRLAARLGALGVELVDAPMTRTPREAEAGRLNVILGGEDRAVEAVRSVIDCYAENVFRSGATGSAHRLKLINNFLSIGCSLVVAESVLAARHAGVDTRLLYDLASQGGANSGAFQAIMPWVNDRELNFRFAIRNAEKDIAYFSAMLGDGTSVGALAGAIRRTLRDVVQQGHGEAFMPELVDILNFEKVAT